MQNLHQNAEFEKLEELAKTIENSPLTRQIRAEQDAEILAKRRQAAAKIELLQKEQAEILPRLKAEIDALTTRLKILDGDREKLQRDVCWKQNKEMQGRQALESLMNQQSAILYESADPKIDTAITFFNEKLSFLRSPGRITRIAGGAERNVFSMTKAVSERSNAAAVLITLQYCQSAIKTLESMKLTPELNLDLIEKMKSEIPSIDVYTEYLGEKPLPKPDVCLPGKSEGHLAYELEKLNEKFKKVMRR